MRWTDPFLASLRRHRLYAGLVGLQAALAAVLMVLGVARIGQLQERAGAPSGLDEDRVWSVRVRGPNSASASSPERQALAALPGVLAVARVNQLPFGIEGWSSHIGIRPGRAGGGTTASVYFGDVGLAEALGLQWVAGRDFLAGEYPSQPMRGTSYDPAGHVLLSRSLAERLFAGGHALGRSVYFGHRPLRVVGIYTHLQGRDPDQADSLVLPLRLRAPGEAVYVMRVRGRAPDVRQVEAAVAQRDARWLADLRSVASLRRDWFVHDRIGQGMLLAGLMLWLAGTVAGIANLSDLLLQARLRQIGIRRALGARAAQIRWQLRAENLWLAGGGAGLALSLAALLWPAWPWLDAALPRPGAAQWLLAWAVVTASGQLAIWPVAREADAISPALASRRA